MATPWKCAPRARKRRSTASLSALCALCALAACRSTGVPQREALAVESLTAPALRRADATTLSAPWNLLEDLPARDASGRLRAVIEIPGGTNQKWEVGEDGVLRQDREEGRPRVVRYLGYPCNYGMVPRTCVSAQRGGDGDPVDVLVLGPALARGSLVWVTPIGILHTLDRGEVDDKVLAVPADSPLADATSLEELDQRYPGVREILVLWLEHYKGPGKVRVQGAGDAAEARAFVERACADFEARGSAR